MTRATGLCLFFAATALGCDGPLADDEVEQANVDSAVEAVRDDGTTFFVNKIFRSGGVVRGYLDRGSWDRGSGPTLLVARLLAALQ